MLRLIFPLLFAISAFAQQDILQVIRVEDVMPLLSSLVHTGRDRLEGAAGHIAEFVPIGGLQNAVGNMGSAVAMTGLRGGAPGRGIPLIGALLPSLNAVNEIKQDPQIPTLAPFTPPQDAARLAADLGAKTAAAKNTIASLASMPAHAVAAGADNVASLFEGRSNMLLGSPGQINELLQFQHALFDSYLAGMNEANSAAPPTTLRDELSRLSLVQPRLTGLTDRMTQPRAFGPLGALAAAFDGLRFREEDATSNVAESLLIDPVSMKIAFANIALNFLESIAGVESGRAAVAPVAPVAPAAQQ